MLRHSFARAAALVLVLGLALPAAAQRAADTALGTKLTPADLAQVFAIPPDGTGLPSGSGSVAQGAEVYAQNCVACHGDKLQGEKAIGGPELIGGRGTLATRKPLKTVESYWPYATTLFDYIKRAMPMTAPGSLTDDQVYAVVAFILARGKVVADNAVMDAATLPAVKMPNRDGFVPDHRPELQLYR
jgi:mono/diheme cytochrome c family protein